MHDFDSIEWSGLTLAERIAHCHRMATEALDQSNATEGESKERFARLAQAWLDAANDLADGKSDAMPRVAGKDRIRDEG